MYRVLTNVSCADIQMIYNMWFVTTLLLIGLGDDLFCLVFFLYSCCSLAS